MRRRKLLAGLAVGASGCLGPTGGQTTRGTTGTSPPTAATPTATATPRSVPDRTGSPEPTATPPASPFPRRVAVEAVDDEPLREAFGVAVEVSVPDAEVTAGDTAQVEVVLRTAGESERTLTYEQRGCWRNDFQTWGHFRLHLLPADYGWTALDVDCPVVDTAILDCDKPIVEETITVPASGTLTWRYDVVVPLGNTYAGCVKPGSYRFDRQFTGEQTNSILPFTGGQTSATLSFTLSVTGP